MEGKQECDLIGLPSPGIVNFLPAFLKKQHLTELSISQPVIFAFGVTCYAIMSVVMSSFADMASGWLRPVVCFYWAALASRKKLDNSSLFLVVSIITIIEAIAQLFIMSWTTSRVVWHLFQATMSFSALVIILPSIITSTLTRFDVMQFTAFSFIVHSVTPFDPSWMRVWLTFTSGVLGVVGARCTETVIYSSSKHQSSSTTSSKSPTLWKPRRHSSPRRLQRRTSFPNLDSARCFSFSSNTTNIAADASLAEAHGIITDVLNDVSLPPRAAGSLRAVASLLAPPTPTTLRLSKYISPTFPIAEVVQRHATDSDGSHPLNERSSSSVMSKKGKVGLPSSGAYRRMSTWSTTTTATGLPMVEPEPSKKRVNFRPTGLPSPSTATPPNTIHQQQHHYQQTSTNQSLSPSNQVPSPKTDRSFSTTSLPSGVKKQLNATSSFSGLSKKSPTNDPVTEEDVNEAEPFDVEEEEVYQGERRDEGKGSSFALDGESIRAHLTSDYDSSNASPSCDAGSEGEVACNSATSAHSIHTTGEGLFDGSSSISSSQAPSRHDIKGPCLLCGRKRTRASFEALQCAKDVWPNCHPPPPIAPRIDSYGRYLVKDGTAYDLEELSVDPLLNLISEWDYPIFDLKRAAGDTILSEMTYRIFFETGLFEAFKIPVQEFLNYFRALECGYRDKPYHNRTHAADVIHGVYYLTSQPIPGFEQIPADSSESPLQKTSAGPLPQSYLRHISVCEETYGIMGANFPALELLALYTAAAMHDFDHPGRTNAFLVSTFAPQALLYNDRSVLENYHAATAWTLFFSDPEHNWLRSLDQAEFKRFRFLVVELILATDLKRHFDILADFNAKVNDDSSPGIDWLSENDRLLVMQMSIKLADINGPCKRSDIHVEWTRRIADEFYEQGDDEARLGLPISNFMDRRNGQVAKLQESFISHLVAPLCNSYAEAGLLPGLWQYQPRSNDDELEEVFGESTASERRNVRRVVCLQTKHLQENYEMWVKEMEEENKRRNNSLSGGTSASSDDSSTPVLNVPMEGLTESDEEQR